MGVLYMNPAPPVIMIVPTSGRGSNLVVPFSIGASFQMSAMSAMSGDSAFRSFKRSGFGPTSAIRNTQVQEGMGNEGHLQLP